MTDSPRSPTSTPSSTPRRLPRLEDFPETGPNALGAFSQRVWARVIDEVLLFAPLQVAAYLVAAAEFGVDAVPSDWAMPPWLVAVAFGVAVVYEIATVALWGKTLGKWIVGVRVARYTDGKRPTWSQSALRCLLPSTAGAVGLALFRFSAIGALPVLASAFSDPLRRGWHDVAGGTIVVRTR
jgi:uncharacterized RDD family membrane protein YckC